MKKILCVLALCIAFISCEKDGYYYNYGADYMWFMKEYPVSDLPIYVGATTDLDTVANAKMTFYVTRSMWGMKEYPKQSARIAVDEKQSTAVQGVDYTLSATSFKFNGTEDHQRPFELNILNAEAGKVLVLQLYYDFEKCPAEGRKLNYLKITVK